MTGGGVRGATGGCGRGAVRPGDGWVGRGAGPGLGSSRAGARAGAVGGGTVGGDTGTLRGGGAGRGALFEAAGAPGGDGGRGGRVAPAGGVAGLPGRACAALPDGRGGCARALTAAAADSEFGRLLGARGRSVLPPLAGAPAVALAFADVALAGRATGGSARRLRVVRAAAGVFAGGSASAARWPRGEVLALRAPVRRRRP